MTRDPIRDDGIRDELDRLGMYYFLDVRATVRSVLGAHDRAERTAFAAAVSQRLISEHEGHPHRREPDPIPTWREALDGVWHALHHGDLDGHLAPVASAVGTFYLSPGYLERRHTDPGDGIDHTMMATLYTAESLLHGCVEFACWAGWRGFDAAAIRAAADREWPQHRPDSTSLLAWELAHPTVQAELGRQLADLELLGIRGWTQLDDDGRGNLISALRHGGSAVL
jgi:hypothetical protein